MACLPTGGYANENGPRKQGMAVSVHGCRCLIRCLLALYLICVVTFAAQADRVSERRAIGLELVLAVDNSLSVNGREFALQIAKCLSNVCAVRPPTDASWSYQTTASGPRTKAPLLPTRVLPSACAFNGESGLKLATISGRNVLMRSASAVLELAFLGFIFERHAGKFIFNISLYCPVRLAGLRGICFCLNGNG